MNFRLGPEYPKTYPGAQFPVEAVAEFWKQMVPDWLVVAANAQSDGARPFGTCDPLWRAPLLISHSQSGIFPSKPRRSTREALPALCAIEPSACPDAKGDMTLFTKMPILVLWGYYVNLSPRWLPRLTMCKAFTEAVIKAGGRIENIVLPEIGIRGNSHMLMQDRTAWRSLTGCWRRSIGMSETRTEK